MIFTERIFLLFFAIVFVVYWSLKRRTLRHAFLLVASYVFYGWWDWRFLGLITAVILTSWATPLLVARYPKYKRLLVFSGVAIILGLLGVFKYADFFLTSLAAALDAVSLPAPRSTLRIILPVGISFISFQAISYLVDAVRKDIPSEQNLLRVAFFISFFPQLVAGPIVRATHFFPQLDEDKKLDSAQLAEGLRAFVIGLIYKAVFADSIAPFVDQVYGEPALYSGAARIFAALGFYCQIYFDFAGYSSMAIGASRMLGFNLPVNFNFPYTATSVVGFWKRWHISLSTWLRDYLYIPLGGNRQGLGKRYRNLMATMFLGGLWHGASWAFVVWGGLHGLALCLQNELRRRFGPKGRKLVLWTVSTWAVTQVFVMLCWIPFRAESAADIWVVGQAFFGQWSSPGTKNIEIPYLILIVPVVVDSLFLSGRFFELRLRRLPGWAFWVLLGVFCAIVLPLMVADVEKFIYFQF